MKHISIEALHDIQAAWGGQLYAFTPTIREEYFGLGVAVANSPGYTPISAFWFSAETYAEAEAEAHRLNAEVLGFSEECADRVIASSMAAGSVSGRVA